MIDAAASPRTVAAMTTHLTTQKTATPVRQVTSSALADLAVAKIAQHAETMPYWKVLLRHGHVRRSSQTCDVQGPLRACYANAMRLAFNQEGLGSSLVYTEGLAFDPRLGMLFEHAWVEDAGGLVHETTWPETADIVYVGIQFDFVTLYQAQLREPGPMIWGDFARDFELFLAHRRCCELEPRRP
jgi:hypothetical protein